MDLLPRWSFGLVHPLNRRMYWGHIWELGLTEEK